MQKSAKVNVSPPPAALTGRGRDEEEVFQEAITGSQDAGSSLHHSGNQIILTE